MPSVIPIYVDIRPLIFFFLFLFHLSLLSLFFGELKENNVTSGLNTSSSLVFYNLKVTVHDFTVIYMFGDRVATVLLLGAIYLRFNFFFISLSFVFLAVFNFFFALVLSPVKGLRGINRVLENDREITRLPIINRRLTI